MGEDLDELNIKELRGLEQSLDETLMNVRQRKVSCLLASSSSHDCLLYWLACNCNGFCLCVHLFYNL